MKTLTTLIATSVLLFGATAANANNLYKDPTSVTTESFNSRTQAYQAGINKLSSLKAATPDQLSDEIDLFVTGNMKKDTIHLKDGAFVTVQERMNGNGQLEYVGVVNIDVDYQYDFNDEN